jgi:hypothetical protein
LIALTSLMIEEENGENILRSMGYRNCCNKRYFKHYGNCPS